MCGLCGAVWTDERLQVSAETLDRMARSLAHRGPDAQGTWHQQDAQVGVALGHRRLSIIDLASGQQPLWNEDRTVATVFNGEIYNYQELRTGLKARGHQFSSDSDTEVIVHLYEEQGPAFVEQLRGMFAIVVWDVSRNRLILARDRWGQKPLIYRQEAGRLLFASELKSLLQVPGVPRDLNPDALEHFLTWQYVPAPWSILKGFNKLLPGQLAIWESGQLTLQTYWQPASVRDNGREEEIADLKCRLEKASYQDIQREFDQRLTEAVRLRLRSDVPLGAFLSGGIDSTLITALMQRELARPVESFSIGFEIPQFDERAYAQMAAKSIGTNHHELIVSPSALESLPRLVWHYDEPFADSSAIPSMELCEFTRKHVTVALTGDAGDELYLGYDRYQAAELGTKLDRLPWPLRALIRNPLWKHLPASVQQKSFSRRLKRFLTTAALDPEDRYMTWICYFGPEQRQKLLSAEFCTQLRTDRPEDWMRQLYDRTWSQDDFVSRTAGVDQLSYLPNDILTKVDIASMAFGLECRSPFLDHRLSDFAIAVPRRYKLQKGFGKQLLRETYSDLIPEPIRKRAKMGFGVPVDHWFRNELKTVLHETLLSERARQRGQFQMQEVERLVQEHVQGTVDHS
ncbi:MAG: asparagine synthase (glutamine-hydrolyzing), partial [Planctomycetaceae bacterium]|nr:asparagine synthase (glutamine-hydrolyzing) [Planctomycetaceae bacterium]